MDSQQNTNNCNTNLNIERTLALIFKYEQQKDIAHVVLIPFCKLFFFNSEHIFLPSLSKLEEEIKM